MQAAVSASPRPVFPVRRRALIASAGIQAMAKGSWSCCAGRSECIFCRIVKEAGSSDTRVLYQDELVLVIPDIKPAAAVHLLVIPKAHIPNVSSLQGSNLGLVRHMAAVGEQVLRQQDQQLHLPKPAQHKFGYHKPPFRSVDHLHLHCFTLPHKWYRWIQYQSELNWITSDSLVDQVARMPSARPAAAENAQAVQAVTLQTAAESAAGPVAGVLPVHGHAGKSQELATRQGKQE